MKLRWKIFKRRKYVARLKALGRDVEILGLEIQSNPKHKCKMESIVTNAKIQIYKCPECGLEKIESI